MILTISERIQLTQFIPKEGNIVEMMLCKDLSDKLNFTANEIEEFKIKFKDGFVSWESSKNFDIEITDSQLKLLKDFITKLDSEKKINLENLDLCLKIKNA